MLFNSIEFLFFFPIVTVLFFILPHKFRWAHLLIASCIFYMAFIPVYILILFLTIIIDYIAGIAIENSGVKSRRKLLLTISLVTNIGILAIFKYYNFFIDNINLAFSGHLPFLKILLPIGLSFHTFQAMSYTIEVYRGNQKAERHFGIYSLYVMFYPQLVAGPIERPQNILHQFHEKKFFSRENATIGLRLILLGFFKKVVIGDRLGDYVDLVYGNLDQSTTYSIVIAQFFYAIQIYCDFSGYSLIAIGTARVMGYDLMKNFNRPYGSSSVTEFWGKWHISLSTWFRDYLYIPLGGNRVPLGRWVINILIVFMLSGLWHGANWTFVAWGFLHALALIYEHLTKKVRAKVGQTLPQYIYRTLTIGLTFLFVCLAWIFFRSPDIATAVKVLHRMTGIFSDGSLRDTRSVLSELYNHKSEFILIFLLLLFEKLDSKYFIWSNVLKRRSFRYISYYVLTILVIVSWFTHDSSKSFIYFQF